MRFLDPFFVKFLIYFKKSTVGFLNQRTNGPVNAHLSLLHIPINMFEYYGINDEALGPFSFFRLINILSMDASRQVSLKSIYWFQRGRYLKGFYHIWAWWPSWSCDLDY